jgi:HlyD family secretion protein
MLDRPLTTLRTAAPAPDVTPAGVSERAPERPRRGRYLALAISIVACAGVAGLLGWRTFLRPLTVAVAPVETNVREQVFGLGTIGARVQSNVTFKVPGVLDRLYADQGDRVSAGQILAKLDASDIEAQVAVAAAGVRQARANLEKAQADVASASANLANAKAMAARGAALIKQNSISPEDAQSREASARVAAANLASAQSLVGVAEAALQSAEAQEAFQKATLAFYSLRAPYDAWVVSRNLELGSGVNPGNASQSVFTLVAADTVWAVGYVDERLAGRLRAGQPAEIVLRSQPNTRIPGRVARIEVQSDAVNQERIVDVAFEQLPENIHLGEQAYVYVTRRTLDRAVVVQPSAVIDFQGSKDSGGRGSVWTLEAGRLERRPVTFGPELLDGRLPILQGLPENAAVVAAPVPGLRVGRSARIAKAAAP